MTEYKTVKGECLTEFEIRRSLFICNLAGIQSFDEGVEFLNKVKSRYGDATHNCYCIVTSSGEIKFSDDGEPQGTAGVPIRQVLLNNSLTNVVAVVTRYFGGIKLGAGGLVGAYTKAVADAVNNAEKVIMRSSLIADITADYTQFALISKYLLNRPSKVLDTAYADGVKVRIAVPTENRDDVDNAVKEITSGAVKPLWQKQEEFFDYGN